VLKAHYIEFVISLRKKYWPLTMMPEAWEKVCRIP
jgi:hypothetical protein